MHYIENTKKTKEAHVTLKKNKRVRAHRGWMWSCDVYLNEVKLGEVFDGGDGAPVRIGIADADISKLAAALKAVDYQVNRAFQGVTPLTPLNDYAYVDRAIGLIADDLETIKKFKKSAIKNTLFTLKGDPQDDVRVLNKPFTAELAERLRQHHGEGLGYIVNEHLEGL